MAMSTESGGDMNAEPNMTPMIDVMLVLLVIFMLIVPMARKGIDVQLPDPTPQPNAVPDPQQIVLEVGPGGVYHINTQPVSFDGLEARLKEIYDPRPDKVLFVKGDPNASYQDIIRAMDIARGAGVAVIGIPPKEATAPAA